MEIRRGILVEFQGTQESGVGYLLIRDSKTGIIESVPCENAPTVRALEACFGNTITEGHTAEGVGYKGREVFWTCDWLGVLNWFAIAAGDIEEMLEEE